MPKKILFIEDESALQRAVHDFFKDENYEIMSALDGEMGVELAKKETPDLILLDLILPKKNGFEVIEDLKQDESTKNIPIIILSNLEGSSDIEKAINLGAQTYLVKSNYKLEEVAEKIKSFLTN